MDVTVHRAYERPILAPFAGMVTAVHVQPGQSVQKGQLLVEFDDAPLRMHLIQARTSLSRLQTQLQLCRRQHDPVAIAQAQEKYDLCLEGVEQLREAIGSASIKAPASGTIQQMEVSLASRVPQGHLVCKLVQPSRFVAHGVVSGPQVREIRIRDSATVYLQGASAPAQQGRIVEIEPMASGDEDPQEQARPESARVTLVVSGEDPSLRPGASGVARIKRR
jgi:multidrug resistance efflux pump